MANLVIGEPPVPDRAALYMMVRNPGPASVRIVGVEVPGTRAEIHRTSLEDGVMRMSPVESLILEPGAVLALRPGGVHIMLMVVQRSLAVGETVPVRLRLEGAVDPVAFTARVVPLAHVEAALEEGM